MTDARSAEQVRREGEAEVRQAMANALRPVMAVEPEDPAVTGVQPGGAR